VETISFSLETREAGFSHTKTFPPGSPYEDRLGRGAGDTTELEAGLTPVVMGGDVGTGIGVFRGETVDGNGDGGSMVLPNAVVPISESTREPIVAVSTEE